MKNHPVSSPSKPIPTVCHNPCDDYSRLLNPNQEPKPKETELDIYFRLAFTEETEGNFPKEIAYYRKASDLATCDCDQQHTLAGKQAAEEAQDLVNRYGTESKPNQFFWGRLQELTQTLPCVQIQQ